MGGRAVDHQGLMGSIGGRPSCMSRFSSQQGSIYGPSSFSSLPLGGSLDHSEMSNTLTSLHEESAETDCFASCSPTSSIVLIPSRPRSDPSTDSQYVFDSYAVEANSNKSSGKPEHRWKWQQSQAYTQETFLSTWLCCLSHRCSGLAAWSCAWSWYPFPWETYRSQLISIAALTHLFMLSGMRALMFSRPMQKSLLNRTIW